MISRGLLVEVQDSDSKIARAQARGQQEVRQQQAKDRDIRDVVSSDVYTHFSWLLRDVQA